MRRIVFYILVCLPYLSCGQKGSEKLSTITTYHPAYSDSLSSEQVDLQAFLTKTDSVFNSRDSASRYYSSVAWDCLRAGEYDPAIINLNKAWLLDSTNPMTIWGFGVVADYDGHYDEALRLLKKSYGRQDRGVDLTVAIGVEYLKQCEKSGSDMALDSAKAWLLSAFVSDSSNELVSFSIAKAMFLDGKYELAWKYLRGVSKQFRNAIDSTLVEKLEDKMNDQVPFRLVAELESDSAKYNRLIRNNGIFTVNYASSSSGSKLGILAFKQLNYDIRLYCFKKTNGHWYLIQEIEEIESDWEQAIEVVYFDDGKDTGFLIKQGSNRITKTLFLYDDKTSTFKVVDNFESGDITFIKGSRLFYTYDHCGCADRCWLSALGYIENGEFVIVHHLRADCNYFYSGRGAFNSKMNEVQSSMDPFIARDKFDRINAEWQQTITKFGYK